MPEFLEKRLKAEYGADSAIPYKIMNSKGLMRGPHETAKGAAMQAKHDADTKKVKPHTGFRSVLKASSQNAHTLSSGERKALPASKFGLPGARKYPLPDKAHAVLAKGRATQREHEGKLSASSAAQIKAKANRVIGKPKASVKNPFTGKAKKKES